MTVVLDTSAVLALLWDEPGGARVAEVLEGAQISAVNLAELVSKLIDRGAPHDAARDIVTSLGIETVAFDADQAIAAGLLRRTAREAGLSLADRACLCLAEGRGAVALTADRAWSRAGGGAEVELIR